MKKLVVILLMAILLALGTACAEEFPMNEFVVLRDGDELALEGETLKVRFASDHEGYTLQIGGLEPMSDAIFTTDAAQLMAVRYEKGLFFFAGGASEGAMNYYHIYEYTYDGLYRMPGEFGYCDGDGGSAQLPRATQYGSFLVDVYDVTSLGAFVHEQEFVVASNGRHMYSDEAEYTGGVYEVPRDMYPYGAVVEITRELPLLTARLTGAETVLLHEGDTAVITACDGMEWARICTIAAEDEAPVEGWLRIDPMLVNGEVTNGFNYMRGIMVGG